METVIILAVCFPFLAAILISVAGKGKAQAALVYLSAAVEIVLGVFLAVSWFMGGSVTDTFFVETALVDKLMLVGEVFLILLIIWLCIKHKKYAIMLLSIVQTLAIVWLELCGPKAPEGAHLLLDRLSVMMVLIVTVVGGLICVYAVGYMNGYHHHHTEYRNRTGFFFPLLFVFLGAMCGLVMSSNLIWMYFFWEITSVVSFLLIGYTQTEEAITNSFRALWMNLLGGVGFAAAILYAVIALGTVDLYELIKLDAAVILLPVTMLAFAALTKSAQMPFSRWLLGAMVAPTPTSALLHSATMVKAGVYLLLRLAPAMHGQLSGALVAYIGGFTFLAASMLAISQSDGKKVLAYSTISNLGLITACAGIGTPETVYAGVLLVIFHAISKSMLFQSVGAVENSTGSRDIEDMRGLILRLPKLAFVMMIGICGMYLAPFGMLISKWAALKAFVDSGNVVLVLMLAFGSATTMFYWTKWLAKILALQSAGEVKDVTFKTQYLSLDVHAALMLLFCVSLLALVPTFIQPMLAEMFGGAVAVFGYNELLIMGILVIAAFIIPMVMYYVSASIEKKTVAAYMAGINTGDNMSFVDSFGGVKQMNMSNWYMEEVFGEGKLLKPSLTVSAVFMIVMICVVVFGGAL